MSLAILEPFDGRIPKWDLLSLTRRSCPFCRTDNQPAFKRPDHLSVAFCSTCACWYVDSIPTVNSIYSFYDGYYYNHYPVTDFSEKSVSYMIENAYKIAKSNKHINMLTKMLGGLHGKRLLDVGCGVGGFLLCARSLGADVIGCDLSPEACEFAINRLGISVYRSDLASCSSSIGKVDAVIMRDFIEHPVEPLIDIQAAISILNPGGILLILTPNGGEAGSNIETGKGWIGFRVDLEHLQYLSPKTINWLSKKYGFIIERIETYGFPNLKGFPNVKEIEKLSSQMSGWSRALYAAKEMLKRIPGVHRSIRILRILKAEIAGEYPSKLNLGSYHLFAILKKG